MTQQEYDKAKQECWEEFCRNNPAYDYPYCNRIYEIAFDRAYALGKQEKDVKKKSALTDKEVYALESAISELESLMDGTLDEDYHKGQKSIINVIKRIIKKYDKK